MAIVYGTNASDIIDATDGVTSGADTIYGLAGTDTIYGLGGNDWIKGGGGADNINGGSGIDTADYSDSLEDVVVTLVTGKGYFGTAQGDTLISVENLYGSSYDDTLIGNNSDNDLNGQIGNDTLKGGGGADQLHGGAGNDTLMGGVGADQLFGGDGIDTADYSTSWTEVEVSLFNHTAYSGEAAGDQLTGIENLVGSAYDDWLTGDGGANELWGLDGNDHLAGGGGDGDVLHGGDGDDWLIGSFGSDTLFGGAGTDNLQGSGGNDILDGNDGDDILAGGPGDDVYYVNSQGDVVIENVGTGIDVVYALVDYALQGPNIEILSLAMGSATWGSGNSESNTIFGNAGDNILNGGGSSDSLNGLGGNDTFGFLAGEANGDVVYEFQGNGPGVGDSLKFIGFGTLAQGASFTQATATEWIIHSGLDSHEEVITIYADGGFTGATLDPSDWAFL